MEGRGRSHRRRSALGRPRRRSPRVGIQNVASDPPSAGEIHATVRLHGPVHQHPVSPSRRAVAPRRRGRCARGPSLRAGAPRDPSRRRRGREPRRGPGPIPQPSTSSGVSRVPADIHPCAKQPRPRPARASHYPNEGGAPPRREGIRRCAAWRIEAAGPRASCPRRAGPRWSRCSTPPRSPRLLALCPGRLKISRRRRSVAHEPGSSVPRAGPGCPSSRGS